jgi:hypothetical protein
VAIRAARAALGRIFFQRCFYLFVALLLLIAVAPLIEPTPNGRIAINVISLFVIVAAVATLGRTVGSFVIALLLALPALALQWDALKAAHPEMLIWSWAFASGLYFATLVYLLRYVFQRDVMTADRLWGAAAAYLMIGVLWTYLYALVEHFYPRSFSIGGVASDAGVADFLYFSFTVLTSTGFGDMAPLSRQARSLCVLEQLVGALFVSILIARLAGVYPPQRRERSPD